MTKILKTNLCGHIIDSEDKQQQQQDKDNMR